MSILFLYMSNLDIPLVITPDIFAGKKTQGHKH